MSMGGADLVDTGNSTNNATSASAVLSGGGNNIRESRTMHGKKKMSSRLGQ